MAVPKSKIKALLLQACEHLERLGALRFTGSIHITVHLNQGGITTAQVSEVRTLDLK
jgi:hypothetical protein